MSAREEVAQVLAASRATDLLQQKQGAVATYVEVDGVPQPEPNPGDYATADAVLAVIDVDKGSARARVNALLNWLIADGHLTPMGKMQLAKVLDEEGVLR